MSIISGDGRQVILRTSVRTSGYTLPVDLQGDYFSWGFITPDINVGYITSTSKIDVESVDWTTRNYMHDWTLGDPILNLTCGPALGPAKMCMEKALLPAASGRAVDPTCWSK